MGPDHSQLEIYNESKHGILFKAQEREMNLEASPKSLGTKDMPVPTCATCHMSGIEGLEHTHDTTERLSWFLADSISTRRPGYETGQKNMKATCLKCHAQGQVETVYRQAEAVVSSTNARVEKVRKLIDEMRAEGLLTPAPFDEPIEFLWFDYWHYFGCTAKHGAFMGGADFVQWHGNYELLKLLVEIEDLARHLREGLSRPEGAPPGESKGPE